MKSVDNSGAHSGIAWAITLAIVAIIMGVIALAATCPRTDLRFDYIGLIVGILTLLVTALIGWQVFNAIEMRTIIDQVDKVKGDLDALANEHKNKISRMEWLMSALHGATFERKTFQGGDTAYFIHCLDVVGDFIKSGSPLNSPPFVNILDDMETTLRDIIECGDSHQIIVLGGRKGFVREWYQTALKIIDTESMHLNAIKERLYKIYEDYVALTKDVKSTPHK